MKPFVRKLVELQLERLGWEQKDNEIHMDTLLRPLIIGLAVGADDEESCKKAAELYEQKITGKNHINPDLRAIIYSNAARKGGQKEFDELLALYKTTSSSDEKLSITVAMTSFEHSDIHKQVLDLIKSDVIRLQDTSYWIAYSFMNRHGRIATWEWLKENWDWLRSNLGTDLSFARMPIYVARSFADDKFTQDFIEFFSPRMEPMLERSFNQGVEIAQMASSWRKRDSENALTWFKNNQK
jgi:aminopeptidase N